MTYQAMVLSNLDVLHPPVVGTDAYQLEDGGDLLQSIGDVILQSNEDKIQLSGLSATTDRYQLEDGTGVYLLE